MLKALQSYKSKKYNYEDVSLKNQQLKILCIYCVALLSKLLIFFKATSTTYTSWIETKKNCKVNGNYPIGNLTFSNITMACTESNYSNTSPWWIGVIHEVNKTEDQGNACLIHV